MLVHVHRNRMISFVKAVIRHVGGAITLWNVKHINELSLLIASKSNSLVFDTFYCSLNLRTYDLFQCFNVEFVWIETTIEHLGFVSISILDYSIDDDRATRISECGDILCKFLPPILLLYFS